MEEDPNQIKSPYLKTADVQKQFEALQKVVDEAQKRIDYTIAHDQDIIKAIEVVERFLRKKERVCYGGQAINSLLPPKSRFYDPEYNIPDYDFFSPTPSSDVDELMEMMLKEGFTEVNKKVGMHEGTMKVYVNYIPVADCSIMNPYLFSTIHKRAVKVDGICYTDPDFLRMMMYLELSRPRGQVERWKKVYERLLLLNKAYPITPCFDRIKVAQNIATEDRKIILEFVLKHKGVLCSPEGIGLMEKDKSTVNFDSMIRFGGPVIFLIDKAKVQAEDLKDILGGNVKVESFDAEADQLFTFVTLKRGNRPLALLLEETACHGYIQLKTKGGDEFRLAFPDTYLHLYYSFLIFGKKEKTFFQTSLECLIKKIQMILHKARSNPSKFVPAFNLRCSGHQKGIATLIAEKMKRTEEEKKKLKKNATRKKNKNTNNK
jgi:hypothetical protein